MERRGYIGGASSSRRIRFGPFELDRRTAELRKADQKIRLQEQPFQILLMLLEQPGDVVLREEIRKRLWPNDTIVEFDHSINAAIKRLRDALGESAEEPRYVETVARRGYRFIGEAETEGLPPPEVPARAAAIDAPDVISPVVSRDLAGKTIYRYRGAVALLMVGAAFGWLVTRTPPQARAVTHVQISVQPADELVPGLSSATVRPSVTAFALSPDGRMIVFSATHGTGSPQLYSRGLAEAQAAPIPGTEGARAPFFSPDGRWIGFFGRDAIKKIPVTGGPAVTVYEPAHGRLVFGASWAEDGTIFFSNSSFGIFKVSPTDGTPTAVTKPDSTKGEWHVLPQPLPGAKAVMFVRVRSMDWENAEVVLQSLETGEQRVLLRGAADARFIPTGHLLYMKTGTLMAVPFDIYKLQVTGEPMALIDDVMQAINTTNTADETGAGQWATSNSGTLLYVPGGIHPNPDYALAWVDLKGDAQPLPSAPVGFYGSVRLSPAGDILALNIRNTLSSNDLWTFDLARRVPTRLTFGGRNHFPIWSPDGKRLVYASYESGHNNLYMVNADGSGHIERLTTSEDNQVPSSWTAHGNLIAFTVNNSPRCQIWVLPMDGDRKPKLFFQSQFELFWPEFSVDGRWIAYSSREYGVAVVYVQPYPGPGEKRRISTEGGIDPAWAPNGHQLFYRSRDGLKFFSVQISSFSPFRAEAPRLLFENKDYLGSVPTRAWDVRRDSQRFLLLRKEESKAKPVTQIEVVLNWTDALRRRVQAK